MKTRAILAALMLTLAGLALETSVVAAGAEKNGCDRRLTRKQEKERLRQVTARVAEWAEQDQDITDAVRAIDRAAFAERWNLLGRLLSGSGSFESRLRRVPFAGRVVMVLDEMAGLILGTMPPGVRFSASPKELSVDLASWNARWGPLYEPFSLEFLVASTFEQFGIRGVAIPAATHRLLEDVRTGALPMPGFEVERRDPMTLTLVTGPRLL